MQKKLTIGIIMFLAGILLNELSYIVDIWFVRILIRISSTIIWMVGLVMSTRAIDYLLNQKKNKHGAYLTPEKDNKPEDISPSGDKGTVCVNPNEKLR